MPPNPPIKALRNTSRKRDVYSPQYYPPMFEHGFTPLGLGEYAPQENLKMVDAIWCVLMYYFDQIKFEKIPLFIRKNIDYSYIPGYTSSCHGLFIGSREIKKKTCSS